MLDAHVDEERLYLLVVRSVEFFRQLLHALLGRIRVLIVNLSQLLNHLPPGRRERRRRKDDKKLVFSSVSFVAPQAE